MARSTTVTPRPHYRIDNDLIDVYGEKIGAIGVAIYNVIARHADWQTGICHPCIGTIAKKLALGRTTVKKYLRILLNQCLIAISPRMSKEGDPTSNSYMILDPSPEKVAQRRRQLAALLTPQTGTFKLPGGRSGDDLPPCPVATDPRSAADPKQSSSLNKNNRTGVVASLPTERQKTCPHPPSEIGYLPADNMSICHHCWRILNQHRHVLSEENQGALQEGTEGKDRTQRQEKVA